MLNDYYFWQLSKKFDRIVIIQRKVSEKLWSTPLLNIKRFRKLYVQDDYYLKILGRISKEMGDMLK